MKIASLSLSLGMLLILGEIRAQSCSNLTGGISCPPYGKTLTFSADSFSGTGGYDIVGCYAPVYGQQSPTVYYAPGAFIGDPPPTTHPGSSDGSEQVYVPGNYVPGDTNSDTLLGCYVWFEIGEWDFGNGGYHWVGLAPLCSYYWCSNDTGEACFAKGTLVLTPQGSKPIEQLKIGDQVYSSSRLSPASPPAVRSIAKMIESQALLFSLEVGGKTIRTTREHQFFLKNKKWVPAGTLAKGDLLLTRTKEWLRVESTTDGPLSSVYSLILDGESTFFVTGEAWEFSVIVSDSCGNFLSPESVYKKEMLAGTEQLEFSTLRRGMKSRSLSEANPWQIGEYLFSSTLQRPSKQHHR